MDRLEKNISIYRNKLGADKFSDWLVDKIYNDKKGVYPFSFSLYDDFDDVLMYVYSALSDTEKRDMRYAFSEVARSWDINIHGIKPIVRLYELAGIVNAAGVFINTADKLIGLIPKENDYVGIIEIGKLLNEVLIVINNSKSKYFVDNPFYDLLRSYSLIFERDYNGKYKYIYSPLFRLACKANYKDWPRLGSILSKRYPHNEDDFWPIEFAKYTNYMGAAGYFNINNTVLQMFKDLRKFPYVSDYEILNGCIQLKNEYKELGGNDFFGELYKAEIIDVYENNLINNNAEITLKRKWYKDKRDSRQSVKIDEYSQLRDYALKKESVAELLQEFKKNNIDSLLKCVHE